MLTGNTELLRGKSVLPTQVQFVFLRFEARAAAVGKPAINTKVQLNDI